MLKIDGLIKMRNENPVMSGSNLEVEINKTIRDLKRDLIDLK